MGARTLKVYDSPEAIIHNRPKKPVRGRAARLAAYRAQRKEAVVEEEETFKPRKHAVEGPAPEPPPAEPGPIVRAYEHIPYSWEQIQAHK